MFQNIENEEERVDKRSVDDLLSFINGGDGGMRQQWFNSLVLWCTWLLLFCLIIYGRIAYCMEKWESKMNKREILFSIGSEQRKDLVG